MSDIIFIWQLQVSVQPLPQPLQIHRRTHSVTAQGGLCLFHCSLWHLSWWAMCGQRQAGYREAAQGTQDSLRYRPPAKQATSHPFYRPGNRLGDAVKSVEVIWLDFGRVSHSKLSGFTACLRTTLGLGGQGQG